MIKHSTIYTNFCKILPKLCQFAQNLHQFALILLHRKHNNVAMNKSIYKKLAISSAIFIALIILCRANIAGYIHPFGFAFAFALIYNSVFPVVTSIELFCALIVQNLSINNIICSATFSAVLFIFWLVQKISKKRKLYLCLNFCAFSCVAHIYFNLSTTLSIVCAISNMLCGVLLCYVFSKLLSTVLSRGIQGLSNIDVFYLCFFCNSNCKWHVQH